MITSGMQVIDLDYSLDVEGVGSESFTCSFSSCKTENTLVALKRISLIATELIPVSMIALLWFQCLFELVVSQ